MAFVPPSSLASAVISGSVSVSNFPASQPVTGAFLTDAQLRATPVPISGTVATGGLTDAQLRATAVPISGTVTADQGSGGPGWAVLQATDPWHVDASSYAVPVTVGGQPILVDGSAVVQPVSVDALPLPDGAATEATLKRVNGAVQESALTAILEQEKIPA